MFPSILADVTSGSADGTGGCGVLLLPNLLHPFGEYGTYLPPLFPGESSPDGPSLGSIAGRSSPILTDFSDFLGRLKNHMQVIITTWKNIENRVINSHATQSQNTSKFTSNISKHTGKFTSKTN